VLSSVRTEGEKRRGAQPPAPREATRSLPAPPVAETVAIRPAGPEPLGERPQLSARIAAIAALVLLAVILALLLL
jgi:hypothetical protein